MVLVIFVSLSTSHLCDCLPHPDMCHPGPIIPTSLEYILCVLPARFVSLSLHFPRVCSCVSVSRLPMVCFLLLIPCVVPLVFLFTSFCFCFLDFSRFCYLPWGGCCFFFWILDIFDSSLYFCPACVSICAIWRLKDDHDNTHERIL